MCDYIRQYIVAYDYDWQSVLKNDCVWQRIVACDCVCQYLVACDRDSVRRRVIACDSVRQRVIPCDRVGSVCLRVTVCDSAWKGFFECIPLFIQVSLFKASWSLSQCLGRDGEVRGDECVVRRGEGALRLSRNEVTMRRKTKLKKGGGGYGKWEGEADDVC